MHLVIDPSDAAPIYEQIRSGIAEQILDGTLAAGAALPSIRALARDLRVSVITTTRAYNELVADGLVDPVRGKGVYVRAQDADALRERVESRLRDLLDEAVRTSRTADLPADRLRALLEDALHQEPR